MGEATFQVVYTTGKWGRKFTDRVSWRIVKATCTTVYKLTSKIIGR